jgi:hypothetical protein
LLIEPKQVLEAADLVVRMIRRSSRGGGAWPFWISVLMTHWMPACLAATDC